MNSISINGYPQLQCGEVGSYAVMSSHLGHHQQCYYMAIAACTALGLDYEQTSPSDIKDAINKMINIIKLFGDR